MHVSERTVRRNVRRVSCRGTPAGADVHGHCSVAIWFGDRADRSQRETGWVYPREFGTRMECLRGTILVVLIVTDPTCPVLTIHGQRHHNYGLENCTRYESGGRLPPRPMLGISRADTAGRGRIATTTRRDGTTALAGHIDQF